MAIAIAVLLILVPSYTNQVVIALASPLTVRVVVASAPVIIFLLQAIEGRLSPSLYSLAATMLCALCAVLAGLARQRAIVTTKSNRKNRSLDTSSLRQPLSADHDRGDNQLERSDVICVSDADRSRDAAKIPGISDWRRNYPL